MDDDREAFPGENLTRLDPGSRPTWCLSGTDLRAVARLASAMNLDLRAWRWIRTSDESARAALIDPGIGVQPGHRLIAAYAREAAREVDFRVTVSASWGSVLITPHRDTSTVDRALLDTLGARVKMLEASTCDVCARAGQTLTHGVARCSSHSVQR